MKLLNVSEYKIHYVAKCMWTPCLHTFVDFWFTGFGSMHRALIVGIAAADITA